MGKAVIFSAPSGSGKSTIVHHLMKEISSLEFSISATSRLPRGDEKDGKEYYFLSKEEFMTHVRNDDFFEWEEVYAGTSYGTLKKEMQRIWDKGNVIVFDVDVKGGINIKNLLGDNALSVFIKVPSMEVLKKRLIGRGTDSEESIRKRLAKASTEMTYETKFDRVVVNDDLQTAVMQARQIVEEFISK